MLVLQQYTHKAKRTARFTCEESTLIFRSLETTHRYRLVVCRRRLKQAQVPPRCRHLTDEVQRTWCVKLPTLVSCPRSNFVSQRHTRAETMRWFGRSRHEKSRTTTRRRRPGDSCQTNSARIRRLLLVFWQWAFVSLLVIPGTQCMSLATMTNNKY